MKDPTRIWSGAHEAYWRDGGAGYTVRAPEAWVVELEEARRQTAFCGPEKKIVLEPAADLTSFAEAQERAAVEAYVSGSLPDCMMPDGGEACVAYQRLHAAFSGAEAQAFSRGLKVGEKYGSGDSPNRWRHKERGTVYREVGLGEVQASTPIAEGELVYVYRGEADGKLWVRREPEFLDGRFERL